MIRFYEDINISERNSFHVQQTAKRLVEFDRAEELPELFTTYGAENWYVLSGGNNILFTKDIDALLITPCDDRIEIIAESDERVRVKVGAGVEWDDLVAWSVERGLWGIENLSLIPGKAGAAPVQNIGAYGVEAKDVIRTVEMYFVEGGNFITLAAEHCDFGYRESVFKHSLKGRVIITAIEIELSKVANPRLDYGDVIREVEARGGATLANIRDAICSIRRSKLPDTAVLGNAGSFFKNPIVDSEVAERLLEREAKNEAGDAKAGDDRPDVDAEHAQHRHEQYHPADLGGDVARERVQQRAAATALFHCPPDGGDDEAYDNRADDENDGGEQYLDRERQPLLGEPRDNLVPEVLALREVAAELCFQRFGCSGCASCGGYGCIRGCLWHGWFSPSLCPCFCF